MTEKHLVWSNEHRAWWGPGGYGYTADIDDAGRFTRDQVVQICRNALPGQYKPGGPLPELHANEADLLLVLDTTPAEGAKSPPIEPAEQRPEGRQQHPQKQRLDRDWMYC